MVTAAGEPLACVVFDEAVVDPEEAVFVPEVDRELLAVDVEDDVDVPLAVVVDVVEVVVVGVDGGAWGGEVVTGVVLGVFETITSRTTLTKVSSEFPGGVPRGSFSFLIVITCIPG